MAWVLGREERRSLAERLMELGNLTLVGLLLGQLLAKRVDVQAAGVGLIVFIAGYSLALVLMRGGGKK